MSDLISRQAAIDALMEILDRPNHAEFLYADEVCKTLNELPSAQPEPCDDPRADIYYLAEKIGIHRLYALVVELRGEPEPCKDAVSRQAAIDVVRKCNVNEVTPSYMLIDKAEAMTELMMLPPAQPEPICVAKVTLTDEQVKEAFEKAKGEILTVQSVREERWIPFKTRSLTKEEKEEHPEWECILDCILPDDGQAILVSINLKGHERVQYDEFYTDDGSYLDSGYEIGSEATAWMPLPEPYREES